ncbi:hypothetical protein CRYUN_Cryun41cG0029500 [Craigia yunnanensis]
MREMEEGEWSDGGGGKGREASWLAIDLVVKGRSIVGLPRTCQMLRVIHSFDSPSPNLSGKTTEGKERKGSSPNDDVFTSLVRQCSTAVLGSQSFGGLQKLHPSTSIIVSSSTLNSPLYLKLRFFLFSLFLFSAWFPRKYIEISSSYGLNSLDEECDEFLPWLERKAGIKISPVLSIGKSAHGRSLFASEIIRTGDCILKVPYSVQIGPDNLLPKINALLSDKTGTVAKLAIILLVEQKMGQDSEWAPYISCFPQHGEIHSTIFWNEYELDMIRQSSVYRETVNQKAKIEKDFAAIVPALEQFPEFFESITLKDFMRAYFLVTSRAWESTKGLSLIPFTDFMNHDGVSDSIVLFDEDKMWSEVIADRNYAPGEEVLISYGKFPNATLLLDFGFALPHNIHDQVEIHLNIPHHDMLREMKLELLQQHPTPTIKDAIGFNCSEDTFIIKEVRSPRGKGKGLPQSLRAFARVLCSTSPQELSDLAREAAQIDGRLARHPLKDSRREFQAHQMLLSHITQLMQKYDVAIKTLAPVNFLSMCNTFALRRQMAQGLLTGELRVLKSASIWLKNYCAVLKSTTHCQSQERKMPRYDDRHSGSRLYVGHLSSRTRSRDLEDMFSRYGRIRDVDMKRDYAFVEFSDPRDADDARYALNGRDLEGSRIIVEFAKGVPRGPSGSRDYPGRGPTPGSGRCFNCGLDGHWARDCKAGDWKNKCYRCGERGHIERNCQNSPKKQSTRPRSYSRTPSPRPRRGRSRSRSYSRGHSDRFLFSSPCNKSTVLKYKLPLTFYFSTE